MDQLGNITINWRTSWTHIVPGNFGGNGYTGLFFYDTNAGEAEFYITDGQGNLSLLRAHTGLRTSWTHIVPGNFGGNGYTDLFFYDANAGEVEYYATDGQGNLSQFGPTVPGWRTSWTYIVPGNFRGSGYTDLLFYDAYAGEAQFHLRDPDGTRLQIDRTGWRTSWTRIVPGNFGGNGYADLLFYDANAGEAEFYTHDLEANLYRLNIDI